MKKTVLGAVLAATVAAMPAQAALVTMRGHASGFDGTDFTNYFGTGGVITGQPASVTLQYETNTAPVGVGGLFSTGNAFDNAVPWLSLKLTVAGVDFVYDRQPLGFSIVDLQLTENGTQDVIQLNWSRQTYPSVPGATFIAEGLGLHLIGDFFSSIDTLPQLSGDFAFSEGSSAGFFANSQYCDAECVPLHFEGSMQLDGGRFATSTPEPGALGLVGAGLLGIAIARRRRTA